MKHALELKLLSGPSLSKPSGMVKQEANYASVDIRMRFAYNGQEASRHLRTQRQECGTVVTVIVVTTADDLERKAEERSVEK